MLKIKIREKRVCYSKNSFYLLFLFIAFVIEKKKKEKEGKKEKERMKYYYNSQNTEHKRHVDCRTFHISSFGQSRLCGHQLFVRFNTDGNRAVEKINDGAFEMFRS